MSDIAARKFDFSGAMEKATREAERQATEAEELLLGRVGLKAALDPAFREALRSDPEKAVQREVDGHGPEIKAVVEAAGKLFSAAVPGAEAQRVEKLIFTTMEDMRKSFKLTLQLSVWLFIAGLIMIVAAFIVALSTDRIWAVGVSGGSGALSLLLSAITNPLDRIRNAAANLTQIQAAYLGFYKQLYILGGSTGTLSRDDAIGFSQEIRSAATSMVESLGSAFSPGSELAGGRLGQRSANKSKPKATSSIPGQKKSTAIGSA